MPQALLEPKDSLNEKTERIAMDKMNFRVVSFKVIIATLSAFLSSSNSFAYLCSNQFTKCNDAGKLVYNSVGYGGFIFCPNAINDSYDGVLDCKGQAEALCKNAGGVPAWNAPKETPKVGSCYLDGSHIFGATGTCVCATPPPQVTTVVPLPGSSAGGATVPMAPPPSCSLEVSSNGDGTYSLVNNGSYCPTDWHCKGSESGPIPPGFFGTPPPQAWPSTCCADKGMEVDYSQYCCNGASSTSSGSFICL